MIAAGDGLLASNIELTSSAVPMDQCSVENWSRGRAGLSTLKIIEKLKCLTIRGPGTSKRQRQQEHFTGCKRSWTAETIGPPLQGPPTGPLCKWNGSWIGCGMTRCRIASQVHLLHGPEQITTLKCGFPGARPQECEVNCNEGHTGGCARMAAHTSHTARRPFA
jgi:hypothetical protein